jgi:hypothetical protein
MAHFSLIYLNVVCAAAAKISYYEHEIFSAKRKALVIRGIRPTSRP